MSRSEQGASGSGGWPLSALIPLLLPLLALVVLGPPALALDRVSDMARERMSQLAGEEMIGVLTEHFEVYYSIPRLRSKNRTYKMEDGAELYADRAEKIFAECSEVLKPRPGAIVRRRHQLVITNSRQAFQKVARKLTGHPGGSGTYQYGQLSLFATFWEKNPDFKSDEGLHEKVAHHIAHLAIQDFGTTNLNFPAWIHAGFAHWIEQRLFRKNIYFCYTEVPETDSWKAGNWPLKIRKEVRRNKHVSLANIAPRPLDALTYRDMAYSMSYVDFLIDHDPEKFAELVRQLKRNPDTSSAVRKVYGWLLGDLEKEWRKHAARSVPN